MNNTTTFYIDFNESKSSLDVILELLKKKKTNIQDINIRDLTIQFVDYVNNEQENVSLETYSDYAKMSAYLIELKARSLLPDSNLDVKNSKSYEEERESFIKSLLEYQMYKNAIPLLNNTKNKRSLLIDKIPEDYSEYVSDNFVVKKLPKYMNPDKLRNAFENLITRNLIKSRLKTPIDLHMSTQEYTVDQVIADLIEIMFKKHTNGCKFSEFFMSIDEEKQNIDYFCMLFFVILSLVHQGYLEFEELENEDFFMNLNSNLLMNNDEKINFIKQIKIDLFGEE